MVRYNGDNIKKTMNRTVLITSRHRKPGELRVGPTHN